MKFRSPRPSLHRIFLLAFALMPAWPAAATSTPPPSPPSTSPPEAVKACSACHGPAGISAAGHVPNLAGQKRAYLAAQLAAFHDGSRKHDVMAAIARQLSAEERLALAAHFASLPSGSQTAADAANTARFGAIMFPSDYPAGYTVYLDKVENGVRTRNLANDAALRSIGKGKAPADGATIIVENIKMADGKETTQSYAVMQADAGWGAEVPELLRNGDWRYRLFTAAKEPREQPSPAECLACHKPKAADAHVFTHADLVRKATASIR